VRLKVHERQGDVLVAACDSDLIDVTLSGEDASLEVKGSFYGEDEAGREELESAMSRATIINVLGEEAVACAVDAGMVDERDIVEIDEVPHAQMVMIL